MKKSRILTSALLIVTVSLLIIERTRFVKEPIDVLKVRVGLGRKFPDPAKIESTGDWYFLDHVSTGLVAFAHTSGKFDLALASEWNSHKSGVHEFKLREDAKFSDGTQIKANDVVASLKRLVMRKTSTHVPLWEYVEGCDNLKKLSDACAGITAINDQTIEIRLKYPAESFFLQLASPETGIWAESDINPDTLELNPTKYSGPYSVLTLNDQGFLVERNGYNPISKEFLNSPRKIQFVYSDIKTPDDQLKSGEADLIVRAFKPYAEPAWQELGFEVSKSAPAYLYYLFGTSTAAQQKIGRDFVSKLWAKNLEKGIYPANTFLPFGSGFALTGGETLELLPPTSKGKIRVGLPWTFVSDTFIGKIKEAGREVNLEIETVQFERKEWWALIDDPSANAKVDFILIPYAASERYPAVQLRQLSGPWRKQPIDLKLADSPDLTPQKKTVLLDFQRWLLRDQHAIPLFFAPMLMIHRAGIDLGEQPPIDAEVELWRVMPK